MNFFHKGKPAAATTEDAQPPPDQPQLPPEVDPNMASEAAVPEEPLPAPSEAPVEEVIGKKSRFARFKPQRPQFPQFPHRHKPAPTPTSPVPNDVQPPQAASPPVDPEKAARRAARRRAWEEKKREHAAEQHRRRYRAQMEGLPEEPLTPLPDFNSASEDEAEPDEIGSGQVVGDAPDAQVVHVAAEGVSTTRSPPSGAGPFIPPSPAHSQEQVAAAPGVAPLSPAPHMPPAHQIPPQAPQQRDPAAEARMAEMFGAQAYAGLNPSARTAAMATAPPPQMFPDVAPSAPLAYASVSQHAPPDPAPIGWGGVYGGFPSQPMYGTPMHLSGGPVRAPMDVDPVLADRIRRGRELASLAIEQETQGNLGAAENGYIKALELLVPAMKELDVGSEMNKNIRMQTKTKVKREAAAMLDRCEELRTFLAANAPAVPQELPSAPVVKPASRKGKSGGGGKVNLPPPPPMPNIDGHPEAKTPASTPGTQAVSSPDVPPPKRPPPPAPPAFQQDGDDLFARLASRRNVLSNAASGRAAPQQPSYPVVPQQPSYPKTEAKVAPDHSKVDAEVAACYMCNGPAQVRAKCQHTFCTKCGNTAANVLEKCPDPDCGQTLDVKEFVNIL